MYWNYRFSFSFFILSSTSSPKSPSNSQLQQPIATGGQWHCIKNNLYFSGTLSQEQGPFLSSYCSTEERREQRLLGLQLNKNFFPIIVNRIFRSKMRIHRIGYPYILVTILFNVVVLTLSWYFLPIAFGLLALGAIILLLFVVQFFRHPDRKISKADPQKVFTPADGTVVVIEKTVEPSYFKSERILVSIFMSPLNVHVNRVPVSGKIIHKTHHPGGYLPAWNPKSSTDNERMTTVIQQGSKELLLRQIAGAMARRIVHFRNEGEIVKQGEELGFIRFGSRVDIFLPLEAIINVSIGDKVKGNVDVLATW